MTTIKDVDFAEERFLAAGPHISHDPHQGFRQITCLREGHNVRRIHPNLLPKAMSKNRMLKEPLGLNVTARTFRCPVDTMTGPKGLLSSKLTGVCCVGDFSRASLRHEY